MRCPFCGHPDTAVKDSRAAEENSGIRRRRHCPECSARFTTVERVQLLPLKVLKKNNEMELFDREKLSKSIELALHKRPIDAERIARVVSSITRQLESRGEIEIHSRTIGEMVMQALAELDAVAYVRFASIYHEFKMPDDFRKFIAKFEDQMLSANDQAIEDTKV